MGAAAPILSVVGTVAGIVQGQKAARETKKGNKERIKAQKTERRIADVRVARQRRQQVAEAKALQAEQVAGGFSSGVGTGSSAVQGSVGAVSSQLGSQIGFSSQVQGLAGQASGYNIAAAQYGSNAATAQAYGNLFQQGATIFSGPVFQSDSTA